MCCCFLPLNCRLPRFCLTRSTLVKLVTMRSSSGSQRDKTRQRYRDVIQSGLLPNQSQISFASTPAGLPPHRSVSALWQRWPGGQVGLLDLEYENKLHDVTPSTLWILWSSLVFLHREISSNTNLLLNPFDTFHTHWMEPGGLGAKTQDGHMPHMLRHPGLQLSSQADTLLPNLVDLMLVVPAVRGALPVDPSSRWTTSTNTRRRRSAGCLATGSTRQLGMDASC